MTPLQFPASRIEPAEDPTERALHTVIDASVDFAIAVVDATSLDRAIQIRRRIAAALVVLTDVENQALRKMDVTGDQR